MPLINLDKKGFPGTYDVCIVGTGAAGITLALELSAAGQTVLLCEGGGVQYNVRSQDAYIGDTSGEPYYPLNTARIRYIGGTTNHWAGMCHPLQPIDFAVRDDLTVPTWPIAFSDIEPHYLRAGEIAGLPDDPWNFAAIEAEKKMPKIVGDDLGYNASAFRYPANTKLREVYFKQLVDTPNITVAVNANFVDVEFGMINDVVSGAKFKNYAGDVYTARAKSYVVACGGIENAKLLLNLASSHTQFLDVAPNIGQYFMEHLCYYHSAYILTGQAEVDYLAPLISRTPTSNGDYQWVAAPTAEARAQHGIANNVSLTLDDIRLNAPDAILGNPVTQGVQSMMKHTKVSGSDQIIYCYVRAEQLPNPESNITLTDAVDAQGLRRVNLNWGFDPRDLESIFASIGLFGQAIAKQDLGRVCITPPDGSQWGTIYGGYHHMGTTRMSESPEFGVVDPNCRVHGINNLYIGGSSVFSTGGWANPTINVVAFAVRLAEHLKTV